VRAMFRGMWLMSLLGLTLTGCAANLAAASSGQLGCPEHDITISDDTDDYRGTRTWTAECGGRRYFCSAVLITNTSGQLNCTEQTDPKRASASPSASVPAKPAVREAAKEPPKGAAGFLFGATAEEGSSVCTTSGHEWKAGAADHYTCSGAPSSIGFPATVTVRFCADKLCAVALQVDAAHQWMSVYAKLSEALTQRYGSPASSVGELGSDCQTESAFESCVMSGGMSLQRVWKWDATSHVSLGLTAGVQSPRLDLLYVHKSVAPVAL